MYMKQLSGIKRLRNVVVMYNLAICYSRAKGVSINYQKAAYWYEKASCRRFESADAAQEYLNMRKSKDIYLVIRIHDKTLAQEVIGYPEDDGATN